MQAALSACKRIDASSAAHARTRTLHNGAGQIAMETTITKTLIHKSLDE